MRLNLKTTIILSSCLAGLLNAGQFALDSQNSHDALASTGLTKATRTTPAPVAAAKPAVPADGPNTASAPGASSAPVLPGGGTASEVAARLSRAGLNPAWAGLYLSVQQQTGTPWPILAAVHKVETGQSGNTTRNSSAGATGPMQFMPATFRAYAMDGDGDGAKNIHDVDDAMLSAGRYLAANGAARGQYSNALYHYNHSNAYVTKVLGIARGLGL